MQVNYSLDSLKLNRKQGLTSRESISKLKYSNLETPYLGNGHKRGLRNTSLMALKEMSLDSSHSDFPKLSTKASSCK